MLPARPSLSELANRNQSSGLTRNDWSNIGSCLRDGSQVHRPSSPYPNHVNHFQELLDALALYRAARHELLAKVGVPLSNRDPLSEFAEVFVAALVGGTCAASRVQVGWDVETPEGFDIRSNT